MRALPFAHVRVTALALFAGGAFASLVASPLAAQAKRPAESAAGYRATANKLIDAALADTTGFVRLAELVDTHGNRLAGSQSLEKAIDWLEVQLKKDGFDNVHTEPVMVPHWVRGAESAAIVYSPITIARVRNAPLNAATLMFGRITRASVVRQVAPRFSEASVSVCTSIARKPASSEKKTYGKARIT